MTCQKHSRFVAILLALSLFVATAVYGEAPVADPAAALRAQYTLLQDRLNSNPFSRPLYVNSRETPSDQKGEVHAVVDYPYASVHTALREASNWCDILILHLNVKYCRADKEHARSALAVQIGRKSSEALDASSRVIFTHRVAVEAPAYFQTQMTAATGPLGTANYGIMVEAVPLDEGRTFIHFSYSYTFGMRAMIAMKAYLNTLGRGKVGFTVVDKRADGQPVYVSDMRGVLERNTMRYYLAIDAYLSALAVPPPQQLDERLHRWFAATERYPAQLHEVEEGDYVDMKRDEYQRQQLAQ